MFLKKNIAAEEGIMNVLQAMFSPLAETDPEHTADLKTCINRMFDSVGRECFEGDKQREDRCP
jgi:hypothetical protein